MKSTASILALLFVAGCSAGASDNAASGPEQDITSGGHTVKGAKAERIIASLESFDAVDHAMGGRASVDIANLLCVASSNIMLDETDPSYAVPITSCAGDLANRTPAHVEKIDAPQKAFVAFDAIGSIDDSFEESEMGGRTYAEAKSVSCSGGTCTVTNLAGKAFTVNGDRALRIEQAFGPNANAENVKCERSSRAPLDEAEPGFNVPIYECASPALADAESQAADLMDAIAKAGIDPDAAMGGKLGVGVSHLTCTKGPGVTTSCTLTL